MARQHTRPWVSGVLLGALVASATLAAPGPAGAEPSRDPGVDFAGGQAPGSFVPWPSAGPAATRLDAEVEAREAGEDYDPWEPFNERTFGFNRGLDRYAIKPVAKAWDKVVPDAAQRALKNAFHNVGMPKRLVNNLLQGKVKGAGRELGRFLINSTVGVAGFFDVAKRAGIEPSNEDTGQTLGTWGVGPGPYLVLPFLPPLTVRDAFGFAVDGLLDPISYVAPLAADVGRTGGKTVNERAENLEVFQDVEESVLDLYSAVRNGYLQRRQKAIAE